MKILEICNITGLSRRNIHFYIKEKLLSPKTKKENGYYDFSEEDCQRLLLIRRLRNAGLPIASIRSILNTPSVSGYYLGLYVNQLKKEIRHQEQILAGLEQITEQLPINPELADLFAASRAAGIPEPLSSETLSAYESGDHGVINQFLWMGFLPDGELTEYQQYLWNKLNRITNDPANQNYRKIRQYLSALPQEKTDAMLTHRHLHEKYIASLDESGCAAYIGSMKEGLREILTLRPVLDLWKKDYHCYFYPMSDIYDSDIQELVAEISPWFSSYLRNIHRICGELYRWLDTEEGRPLLNDIRSKLDGYLDLNHCHHCELEALYSCWYLKMYMDA